MSGQLYEGLAGYSFSEKDKQKAVAAYDKIIRAYPGSRYKQKQRKTVLNWLENIKAVR